MRPSKIILFRFYWVLLIKDIFLVKQSENQLTAVRVHYNAGDLEISQQLNSFMARTLNLISNNSTMY